MNITAIQATLAKIAAAVALIAASSSPATTTPKYQAAPDTSAICAVSVDAYRSAVQACITSSEKELLGSVGARQDGPNIGQIEDAFSKCITQPQ